MATARERKATRILERIPGRDGELGAGGRYAFLELEAENVDAFEALRAEAAESPLLLHYDFGGTLGRKIAGEESEEDEPVVQKKAVVKKAAAAAKARTPASKKVAAPAAESEVDSAGDEEAAVEADNAQEPSSSAAATEGLSPLEIARQKLLAKRGAK